MKRCIFILMMAILLSSCSIINQDISKIKEIETNEPPISSKDSVLLEANEREGVSNEIDIVQVEEKIETSTKKLKTTTYDESPSNQNKKPNNTIYTKIQTYINTISYQFEEQNDSTLDKGLTKIKQTGKDGQRKIVVEITYNNNKEINRKTISDTIVTEPVNEIIIMGTKEKEIPPKYECPTGYDKNRPCDDRVYNSDLDTAYLIIKVRDLSICQNEGLKVGGQIINEKFVARWSCHAILHNDPDLGQWGYALYLYDDDEMPIK
ncbi:G5 domain-containing protein [Erysipelothrix rhusiopathiae]|nr:G5 domain-containing protein [Erysipelothrix rhusiopathiae]